MEYEFTAELWLYQGKGAWHFVTLPQDISAEVKKLFGQSRQGWGSIRVTASIGDIKWQTSIFPDKKSSAYLLPVKSDIREKAKISNGDRVKIKIKLHT